MPNHVHNTLYIAGWPEEVKRFATDVGERSICDALLPLPEEASVQMTAPDGKVIGSAFATIERDGVDGYRMAIDLWGTKWGDYETRCNGLTEDGVLSYSFDTAWGIADKAFISISAEYPLLRFALVAIEEQPAFCCAWSFANGAMKLIHDTCLRNEPSSPEDDDAWETWYYEVHEPWTRALVDEAKLFALDWATGVPS